MIYPWIKLAHVSCVAASLSLFVGRGAWRLGTDRPLARWLRIAPHVIDTLLLATGLTLAFLIRQYPFVNSGWLTAKIIGLIVYIALGMLAFRTRWSKPVRWWVWIAAIAVFGYIVSVAVSKSPAGPLALWRL